MIYTFLIYYVTLQVFYNPMWVCQLCSFPTWQREHILQLERVNVLSSLQGKANELLAMPRLLFFFLFLSDLTRAVIQDRRDPD